MGANPISAFGSGGRFTRPDDSEMWDSMSIDYEYSGPRQLPAHERHDPMGIAAAYKQEHRDLIDSIRAGKPIVELRQTADSSIAAVLGRVAAYTGWQDEAGVAGRERKIGYFSIVPRGVNVWPVRPA